MYEVLPFPNVKGSSLEEVKIGINDYLIQLTETLEFILGDIGFDNLSQEVKEKIPENQMSIGTTVIEDEFQQVASKTLTVSDVINSELFKKAMTSELKKIKFTINYETGNLEYQIKESGENVQN
jgi:hypothetical protein